MMEYRKKLWEANPENRAVLANIIRNPIFQEAVSMVVISMANAKDTESAQLSGAAIAGVRHLLTELESFTTEKEKPTKKQKPFEHITVEKSVFGVRPTQKQNQ